MKNYIQIKVHYYRSLLRFLWRFENDNDGRCTKLVSFSAKTRPLNKVENPELRETKRRRLLITIFFFHYKTNYRVLLGLFTR